MPREAGLGDSTNGSALEAYRLPRHGGGNIPRMWIKRARASRKNREKALAAALRKNSPDAFVLLRNWDHAFRKECSYHGIRVLMELQRDGQSKM